jgi:hypothetical protein
MANIRSARKTNFPLVEFTLNAGFGGAWCRQNPLIENGERSELA